VAFEARPRSLLQRAKRLMQTVPLQTLMEAL
jgi:hypothetical protein